MPVPVPGPYPYPGPGPSLKYRLITVIQNEQNPYWNYYDRQQAIRELQYHPGDITPNQDARLRQIYRGGGSLQEFLNVLHFGE